MVKLVVVIVFAFSLLPARAEESPLARAERWAKSPQKQDRQRALALLRELAHVGDEQGERALFGHAELCLELEVKDAATLARQDYQLLAEKGQSSFKERGQIGLWRLLAAEESRAEEAAGELDRFLTRHKSDRSDISEVSDAFVDAAYHLGLIQEKRGKLRAAAEAYRYALKWYQSLKKAGYYFGLLDGGR